jgi:hypothetical protein
VSADDLDEFCLSGPPERGPSRPGVRVVPLRSRCRLSKCARLSSDRKGSTWISGRPSRVGKSEVGLVEESRRLTRRPGPGNRFFRAYGERLAEHRTDAPCPLASTRVAPAAACQQGRRSTQGPLGRANLRAALTRRPRPAAEAGGHRRRASPNTRAGARCRQVRTASSSPAVSSMCSKQRFPTVANGQQRSVAVGHELPHRPSTGGLTVLPKLAVQRRTLIG